jgi:NAD(P)-dependent dehydrogenase (short-subunit alcohol dehydrogenase family)
VRLAASEEDGVKVFVAGGTGTIGVPLVRALVAAGHEVFATTRALEKQPSILDLRLLTVRLPLSNEKTRELGWAPAFPSYREGLPQTVGHAA